MKSDEHFAGHLEHIEHALSEAKTCLGSLDVRLEVVPADRLSIVLDGKRLQVYPEPATGALDPHGEAVVFVTPGTSPHTVLRGTYIIVGMVLAESATYFKVPGCDPAVFYGQ